MFKHYTEDFEQLNFFHQSKIKDCLRSILRPLPALKHISDFNKRTSSSINPDLQFFACIYMYVVYMSVKVQYIHLNHFRVSSIWIWVNSYRVGGHSYTSEVRIASCQSRGGVAEVTVEKPLGTIVGEIASTQFHGTIYRFKQFYFSEYPTQRALLGREGFRNQ